MYLRKDSLVNYKVLIRLENAMRAHKKLMDKVIITEKVHNLDGSIYSPKKLKRLKKQKLAARDKVEQILNNMSKDKEREINEDCVQICI